jgi:hypothetical protein
MNKGIIAMRKAGRIMATSATQAQRRMAARYLDLAMAQCEEHRPSYHAAQAAYNDGLKGKPFVNRRRGI